MVFIVVFHDATHKLRSLVTFDCKNSIRTPDIEANEDFESSVCTVSDTCFKETVCFSTVINFVHFAQLFGHDFISKFNHPICRMIKESNSIPSNIIP